MSPRGRKGGKDAREDEPCHDAVAVTGGLQFLEASQLEPSSKQANWLPFSGAV